MKRNVVKCKYCGREVSKSNLLRHEQSCSLKSNKVSYKLDHDGLICQFCGKECKNRNSLCNHERLCRSNPNRQQNVGFDNFNESIRTGNSTVWNKGLTADTDERVNKGKISLLTYYENNKGSWYGRKHTDDEKRRIGEGVKAYLIANPDMVPYLRNHSSKESYPEIYFMNLFKSEGIDLIYHHRIHTYELDFCNIDKKLDIEVDGEQHYLDAKVIESDRKRTEYLESLGWKIFRIRWSEFKKYSEKEKSELLAIIKELLV